MSNETTNKNAETVANNVRTWETIINIIWVIIGASQCLTIVCAPLGIWNLINSIKALQSLKNIQAHATWIPNYYEKRLTSIIISMILNFIFTAGIGSILAIGDLLIRNYVLNNKDAFLN